MHHTNKASLMSLIVVTQTAVIMHHLRVPGVCTACMLVGVIDSSLLWVKHSDDESQERVVNDKRPPL